MRSLRAAVGASAAALLLLAGCGGDPDPGDPSSTWTPTGTPESPTSAATQAPVEPKLPQAATKATEDGARAFIGYYWDVVNYAQATGNLRTLRSLSAATCDTCVGFISDVRQLYESGGRIVGGSNNVRVTRASKLSTPSGSGSGFRVEHVVSHAAQTIVNKDGSKDERKSGSNAFTAYLLWADGTHWRLDVMELR
jgi:hypothetical protein